MADPYLLPPQSVVSFSGGRTSGYLLRKSLDAFGGSLPEDRAAIFCNTGKEREETLEFVRDCAVNWGVPIRWLEYRWEPGRNYFVEVTFQTASRAGEPFEHAIRCRKATGYLPNPSQRHCTIEMKLLTSNRFVRRELGWGEYHSAVGLRADEPLRVAKLLSKGRTTVVRTLFGDEEVKGGKNLPGETPLCPLAAAGVTLSDVLSFWSASPFDLKLPADERTGRTNWGNCDLCFLKGAGTLVDLIRENPESADWWVEQERKSGRLFRHDRPPYEELRRIALGMVDEPGWLWADRGGVACGAVIECNCTD